MPRSVQITVPAEQTDKLLDEIRSTPGLISLSVQRGVSIKPTGDVVSMEVTTPALHAVMRLLDREGISTSRRGSVQTSQPLSIVAVSHAEAISKDSSDATWEEMGLTLSRESNMTVNGIVLMLVAGAVAAIGIGTETLHLVIGAMVIAPGFEPISRVALGAVAGGSAWREGLLDTAKGYLALAAGASVAVLALPSIAVPPAGGSTTYLASGALTAYWTSITASGLVASTVAGIGGGVLIASNRSILTAGVMIALALVPSLALAAMALASGEPELSGKAFLRWLADVAIVGVTSAAVFGWKRFRLLQRKAAI